MKAKEYVAQYKNMILLEDYIPSEAAKNDRELLAKEMNESVSQAVHAIMESLSEEAREIIKARNARSATAQVAVWREMNDKWNSIATQINKLGGHEYLKLDAMRNFIFEKHPMLREPWLNIGSFTPSGRRYAGNKDRH